MDFSYYEDCQRNTTTYYVLPTTTIFSSTVAIAHFSMTGKRLAKTTTTTLDEWTDGRQSIGLRTTEVR